MAGKASSVEGGMRQSAVRRSGTDAPASSRKISRSTSVLLLIMVVAFLAITMGGVISVDGSKNPFGKRKVTTAGTDSGVKCRGSDYAASRIRLFDVTQMEQYRTEMSELSVNHTHIHEIAGSVAKLFAPPAHAPPLLSMQEMPADVDLCFAMQQCVSSVVCDGLVQLKSGAVLLVAVQDSNTVAVEGKKHLPQILVSALKLLPQTEVDLARKVLLKVGKDGLMEQPELREIVANRMVRKLAGNGMTVRTPETMSTWSNWERDGFFGMQHATSQWESAGNGAVKAPPLENTELLAAHSARSAWHRAHSGLVVSLTTMPVRLGNVRLTLESLLRQTVVPEAIYIAIPYVSVRTKEKYEVPAWLESFHPRVKILRTEEDYGPATKLIPLLKHLREEGQEDQPILVVDDDTVYAPQLVEHMMAWHSRLPDAALSYRGWRTMGSSLPEHRMIRWGWTVQAPYRVNVITANCGYLVQPRFFTDALWDYSRCSSCFFMDDPWISGNLARNSVPKFVVPSSEGCLAIPKQSDSTLVKNIGNRGRNDLTRAGLHHWSGKWEKLAPEPRPPKKRRGKRNVRSARRGAARAPAPHVRAPRAGRAHRTAGRGHH